jgi:SAM-dependent methyltransferase
MKLLHELQRGLRRRFNAIRRRADVLVVRTASQKRRLAEDPSLKSWERELLLRASSCIHPEDDMYRGDGVLYYKVALSALRCIEEGLKAARISQVRTVLDMPCGYGRVMRLLVGRYPDAKFTACEITKEAVDFCVRNFGAQPFYSAPDFDGMNFRAPFDLIWSGSLVTHLNSDSNIRLLQLFSRTVADGGIAIITAHGDYVARRILTSEFDYGITPEQSVRATSEYSRSGFAYVDYPQVKGYGVSLTSPAWIREQAGRFGLREVFFKPRLWDDHQDVYGFVKAQD